ncbi:uncharacterized protein PADG_11468 [Paracoccidioides brasiliensis Pb18]|uniref:NADPH-dependent diflavin oxidoreductase 1 n=1 Tax=Paracoccidioides brasiliensis (strain Pb18) TaxID=502780 RepID=A0A0A0HY53_PARBD|nr:uncharacterized protein PADG_11468 [Paracoccidioides brasiliensis Pb18]KGM92280.1 hypothetical protein PADG_11468 [Paracoccidioides brasiliensis Pb18]
MATTNSSSLGKTSARTAIILYGSETGNSRDVADELGRLAERLRFTARVCELNAIKAESLHDYDIAIFVVSTTGQGDFPANAQVFWKSLLLKRLPPTFLHGVNFALFGLGDSSYPKFNWASRKLYKRLLQLGANELYPCGEADEQHPEGFDGTFIPWSLDLRKHLLDKYPLAPGQHPIPDDVRLPPKWVLARRDSSKPEVTSSYPDVAISDLQSGRQLRDASVPPYFTHDLRPIPNTVSATLTMNNRVTPEIHWQDVRHLILTTPGSIPYSPGDILQITPRNFVSDVDSLISIMGWQKQADIPLCFVPNAEYVGHTDMSTPEIPFLLRSPGFTLRTLLTDYLDIMAIPRRSFFSNISHFTSDITHRERLQEFTNPKYIDEFYDYTSRPRRSILEVLHEFDSVKIPWQQVCAVFPVLRGRQFSLASGGKLKKVEVLPGSNSTTVSTRFDLLVAVVKYQTVIKKMREGVCTRYLAALQPGSSLKVHVQKGGLNSSMRQLLEPTVLIGPGTGVAPLRSMLWEKAAMATAFRQRHGADVPVPLGPIVLLFGGRNRKADFFFEDEWEELKKVLDLTVITAFSRDQREKIYVQDRIREHAELFFSILHDLGGTVYICGSSGKMPQAVREALIEVFQMFGRSVSEEAPYSREMAEKYLMNMEKAFLYAGRLKIAAEIGNHVTQIKIQPIGKPPAAEMLSERGYSMAEAGLEAEQRTTFNSQAATHQNYCPDSQLPQSFSNCVIRLKIGKDCCIHKSASLYILYFLSTMAANALRILVPVKRVIDFAIKPRINKTQTGVETAGVKHSLNPFDELSIEEAVRLRESKGPMSVSEILAISAGGPKCVDTLRTAMAMGADRSILVDVPEKPDQSGLEPLTVAKLLKNVVQKENINMVLLGKQAIDGDQGQTGQMLAGLLGWPQATQASKLVVKDDKGSIEVTREVDGGVETLKAKLPMVITTDLRLNTPRYASLPNIMKAKKKPLEKKTLADFEIVDEKRLKTLKVTEPPARQGGGKVEDVDGMISKLKELGAL